MINSATELDWMQFIRFVVCKIVIVQHVRDMQRHSDIAIVGGGLVGNTLALALANAGFTVTMLDRSHEQPPRDSGRSFAMSLASCRMLAKLGIGDVLADKGQEIRSVRISEGLAGQGAWPNTLVFDPCEIDEDIFGFMISEHCLQAAIGDEIRKCSHMEIRHDCLVVSSRANPASIHAVDSSGNEYRSTMLAVCDGQSGCLEGAGFSYRRVDYDQSAVACTIAHEREHGGCMQQFFMPAGPIAILPLPENRSAIIISTDQGVAKRLMHLDKAEFTDAIRPMIGNFLGKTELVNQPSSWSLSASMTNELVSGRIALVGDSVRRIHPLAGQGLNLGLRDIATLVSILVAARRRGEDIGNVLPRYQKLRRADSVAYTAATDFFNRIYSTDNPTLELLRRVGVTVLSNMPSVRTALLHEAAGLSGELPELMN